MIYGLSLTVLTRLGTPWENATATLEAAHYESTYIANVTLRGDAAMLPPASYVSIGMGEERLSECRSNEYAGYAVECRSESGTRRAMTDNTGGRASRRAEGSYLSQIRAAGESQRAYIQAVYDEALLSEDKCIFYEQHIDKEVLEATFCNVMPVGGGKPPFGHDIATNRDYNPKQPCYLAILSGKSNVCSRSCCVQACEEFESEEQRQRPSAGPRVHRAQSVSSWRHVRTTCSLRKTRCGF